LKTGNCSRKASENRPNICTFLEYNDLNSITRKFLRLSLSQTGYVDHKEIQLKRGSTGLKGSAIKMNKHGLVLKVDMKRKDKTRWKIMVNGILYSNDNSMSINKNKKNDHSCGQKIIHKGCPYIFVSFQLPPSRYPLLSGRCIGRQIKSCKNFGKVNSLLKRHAYCTFFLPLYFLIFNIGR